MMKSSLRDYTHVMKIRTDYQPWVAPWISGMFDYYEQSGRKIVVDSLATIPRRYPDRIDIPWQGSISDLFCFASFEQFLKLWDIENILPNIWTGIPETSLFRAAMVNFLGDELQSPMRNRSFLEKYFVWQKLDSFHPQNEPKTTLGQSVNILRAGVLSKRFKDAVISFLDEKILPINTINKTIRFSYNFISGNTDEDDFRRFIKDNLDEINGKEFLHACLFAKNEYSPV